MRIALYSSAHDSTPVVREQSWPELVAMLTKHTVVPCAPCVGHRCGAKVRQAAWSPVDIAGRRANTNVKAITVAVFDLDNLSDEGVEAADKALEGYAAVLYSTHTHRPGNTSLRVVVPLSRPVLPPEWLTFWNAATAHLGLLADPAAKDLARLFFLPNHSGEYPAFTDVREGRPLDVDAVLAAAKTGAVMVPGEALGASLAADETPLDLPVDLHDMAGRIRRGASQAHKALVSRALAGRGLSPQRSGPYGGQDIELHILMSTAAFCLPDDASEDAVMHLFRPCFAATDWGDGTEHLVGEARKKFEAAKGRKAKRDAKALADNQALFAKLGLSPATEEVKAALAEPTSEDAEDPTAWMKQLIAKGGVTVGDAIETDEPTKLSLCESNVLAILTHSPEWKGVLRFNEVTKDLEINGGPIPGAALDGLDVAITVWLQRSAWGRLGIMPKPGMVRDVIPGAARANAYDPIKDYLEGLVWDGTPRVDTFFETYFGAKGDLEHVRTISRKWLLSLVARGLKPGCKVDTVLILEGAQGKRKSTALRTIAGEWFSDADVSLRDKDSASLVGRHWLLELGELTTFRSAADADALKQFLSRNEDTYRPPYGRTTLKFPRRAVFVGSTNTRGYLRADPTGYRRFWPIACGDVDYAAVARDRDQVIAEAVAMFKRGEQWWLNEEEAARAGVQAEDRAEEAGSGKQEVVEKWLLAMDPEARPRHVRMSDVQVHAFGLTTDRINASTDREAGAALRALGFVRGKHKNPGGGQRYLWTTPEALLVAPREI